MTGQKMMMNTARMISGKNLEELNELTENYVHKE